MSKENLRASMQAARDRTIEVLDKEIGELIDYCDKDARVSELVSIVLLHRDRWYEEDGTDDEAINLDRLGGILTGFIWEIMELDVKPVEFNKTLGLTNNGSLNWVSELNFFIGNFLYDDSAFDFKQNDRTGQFEFKTSTDRDRFLQNPMILVEAAKATLEYRIKLGDERRDRQEWYKRYLVTKVDGSRVLALLEGVEDNE